MNNVKVLHALPRHKDFILQANTKINDLNKTEQGSNLAKNIDNHLFAENPKFQCLIAEVNDEPVGMILYSTFYWADDGEVLWLSQMYIKEEYRKQGIFFKLINKLKEENKDIHILSCATGDTNARMNKILKGYGAKIIDLNFYYKEI